MKIKSSQIAGFLNAKLYGKDILIEKPVSVYNLCFGSLSFVKEDFLKDSLVSQINSNPESLIICPEWYKDKIKSSFIISQRPYYDFSRALKEFFVAEPKITVGKNCVIRESAIIGKQGHSFSRDENNKYVRNTHIGGVRIGDNVEIGSLAVIDRGVLDDTVIGSGVKIDSRVFVGHNCVIGQDTMITAGAVLGGGVVVGKNCFIGLGALIRQRVKIGDNAFVGMGSVVINNVRPGETVFGSPAKPIKR